MRIDPDAIKTIYLDNPVVEHGSAWCELIAHVEVNGEQLLVVLDRLGVGEVEDLEDAAGRMRRKLEDMETEAFEAGLNGWTLAEHDRQESEASW